jgi:hypothetical protein
MKERPILFSGPMVRALLAGAKTQTRRLMKPQPDPLPAGQPRISPYDDSGFHWASDKCRSMVDLGTAAHLSPYGSKGDRLWVRETWSQSARSVYPCPQCWYRADYGKHDDPAREQLNHDRGCTGNQANCFACVAEREGKFVWRPSIFMPRWASRITLEVTSVRVERLQAISEEDAKAEGVHHSAAATAKQSTIDTHGMTPCRAAFAALWEQINGKKAPWSSNPFCWAISFRRTV